MTKYSLRLWHGHDFTVDKDGCDDGESEHGVGEDSEGNPPDWVKRREDPHCLRCREPENERCDHDLQPRGKSSNFSVYTLIQICILCLNTLPYN